jgi:hypothetical protein
MLLVGWMVRRLIVSNEDHHNGTRRGWYSGVLRMLMGLVLLDHTARLLLRFSFLSLQLA